MGRQTIPREERGNEGGNSSSSEEEGAAKGGAAAKGVAATAARQEEPENPKLSFGIPKERTTGDAERDEAIRQGGGIPGKRLRNFRIALLANAGSGAANPLPRTLHRTLRVWWAFIWRVIVFSVIVRIAGSIALGSIVAILSATGRAMAVLMPLIMQVAIDAAVGLFVMYSAILDEQFGDFRVALLPRKDAAPAVAPAPSSPPTLQPQ
jgi:hypothetical protein